MVLGILYRITIDILVFEMMIFIGETLTANSWNDRELQGDGDESLNQKRNTSPQSLSVILFTFPLLAQWMNRVMSILLWFYVMSPLPGSPEQPYLVQKTAETLHRPPGAFLCLEAMCTSVDQGAFRDGSHANITIR